VRETGNTVRSFLSANKYAFPIVLDSEGTISSMFVGRGIPTTYVVDREGKAIAGLVGGREWNTAEVYEIFDSLAAR
jgi:hypothetical protein